MFSPAIIRGAANNSDSDQRDHPNDEVSEGELSQLLGELESDTSSVWSGLSSIMGGDDTPSSSCGCSVM